MKLLTVVFPLYSDGTTDWILMGRQGPNKKMPGIRNGPGGKVDPGEDPLDGAVREVQQEIGVELKKEDLKYIGLVIEGEKQVFFYAPKFKEKIEIADNEEMVDCKWFDVEKMDTYLSEMLPGDEVLMREVIRQIKSPETFAEFKVDKSNNKELQEITKNIFGKIS